MQWSVNSAHGLEPAPMEAFQSLPFAQLSKARLDDRPDAADISPAPADGQVARPSIL